MTFKRAVVTGASSGIGWATVVELRSRGWDVVGVARRADRLAALEEQTGARVFTADLTVQDDVDALAEFVASTGGADAVVNNAGGAFGLASVEDSSVADWERMYAINVLGTKRVVSALLPVLRRSIEPGKAASIVGITSIAGQVAYEGGGGYNAAKFAQRAVMEVLRLELAGEPIRVIDVAPGMVHTEEFSLVRFGGDKAKADAVYAEVPEPLTAEDIAETIAHALDLPPHVNIDSVTVKPVAQAAPHKVAKGPLKVAR
ncbi:NADP-dependent 3-hydroxy acid dehydrogenase YdfG [Paramicrobacterium humi]|uniref:NADP-dependent 3-hydroxy acid dehydrogenase YdfG n=1 Tax=Paramicrobacterium humi TaxID=640635 RepID=A0A1H4P7E4_9MICO|nr:SDR family oxidoreductase [Microbacterium humi]SEC03350.1 NADP-dependent 3-hydroxy acid dehydrogenase YdfG [Microbacterium humi]